MRSRSAAREKLDNLIFVINCNLQRLHGPVRGNGKIIQELEGLFRGAGWNVIKNIWASCLVQLKIARDDPHLLGFAIWMRTIPAQVVQIYLAISASAGSGRAVPVGVGTAVVGGGDRCSSYDGLRTVGTAVRRSAAWPSGHRHPRRARGRRRRTTWRWRRDPQPALRSESWERLVETRCGWLSLETGLGVYRLGGSIAGGGKR